MIASMVKFLKDAPGMVLAPALVVGAVAVTLYFLGLMPGLLQGSSGAVREYATIEEAEARVGFRIAVPAYFPIYLSWPPAKILGQREPAPMSQMLFLSSDGRTEALSISQALYPGDDLRLSSPWGEEVEQEMPIVIGDSQGTLTVGRRADGRLINGARWRAKGFYFLVVTIQPVQELLTLARSVHP